MENNEMLFDDAFFQNYADQIKKESEKKSGGAGFTRTYEDVAYVAAQPGVNVIVRMIGIPPGDTLHQRRPFDPKTLIMSDIKSDDGKRFTLKLPVHESIASKEHIIHRLYARINEVAWINKQKTFVNESKFPELVEKSQKMGFTPDDGDISYKSAAGLKGTKYIVQNVIDRQDKWCVENKHTKILANSGRADQQGRIWYKPGIKEFGYAGKLADLMAKYKHFENYDIAIKRVQGAKLDPWELRNASLYAEKDLMEELKNDDGTLPDKAIIVIGPLTSEERKYETYDLDKFYGNTTYQTILKRIPSIFKECDAALKTKFYDELVALADKEKKEFEIIYKKNESETAAKETATVNTIVNQEQEINEPFMPPPDPPIATTRRTASTGGLSADKIALLKGYNNLTDEEKKAIQDVTRIDENLIDITFSGNRDMGECPECTVKSPLDFKYCPACGVKFD